MTHPFIHTLVLVTLAGALVPLTSACVEPAEPTDSDQAGTETGTETGTGTETSGDGDLANDPVSCLGYVDTETCGDAGCTWGPAMHISADPMCVVGEITDMCLPMHDGGDPACFPIPGCPDPDSDPPPPEGSVFGPAWIAHPEGGWVVIDACGWFDFEGFVDCASGEGDDQPPCHCACGGV